MTQILQHSKIREVFKFLQWKVKEYRNHFSMEDYIIISDSKYGSFFNLSPKACSYTQLMMNHYIETELWKSALKTQFQIDGYYEYPKPSCATLPIAANTTREKEVLLMSLFYKNNISNSSLYKLGRVPSPLCSMCEREEDTPDHIIFRCPEVDAERRRDAATQYRLANNLEEREDIVADFIALLNTSRHKPFMDSCVEIINLINVRTSIDL